MHRLMHSILLCAFALVAASLQFDQPLPTEIAVDGWAENGFSPKPTAPSPALLRRQDQPNTVCAYLSGDPTEPLTCASGMACGYNTRVDWFGCCSSAYRSGTSWAVTGCAVVTGCVEYQSINACANDPSCASDTALRFCTNAQTPYCLTGALIAGQTTLVDYACATVATILGFLATPTGETPTSPTTTSNGAIPTSVISRTIVQTTTTSGNGFLIGGGGGSAVAQSPTPFTLGTTRLSTSTQNAAALPTGAVIGGAIGGVAAVVALFA